MTLKADLRHKACLKVSFHAQDHVYGPYNSGSIKEDMVAYVTEGGDKGIVKAARGCGYYPFEQVF